MSRRSAGADASGAPPFPERGSLADKGDCQGLFAISSLLPEERKDFYSALSHVLRNPLNGAYGYLDYLFKGYSGEMSGDQLKQLGHARDSVLQLQKAVDVLMDVAAFDLGLVRPSLEPLNLNDFCTGLVQESEDWVTEKDLSIKLELPPQPLWAAADKKWLRVLAQEILSNAVRVSPPSASVEIRLWKEGPSAFFRVRDQGPGIPANRLAWIFRPFTQLKRQSDPPRGERGGLGLALAERIVSLHGGRIWAEGEPPGLSVSACLPLATPRPRL
jgi:signal transduction histidine kinase